MKKIKKALRAMGMIIRRPWLLNHVLDDNQAIQRLVAKKYGLPNGLMQIQLADLFPEEGITVAPFAGLSGGCTPLDLALLKAICIRNNVEDYLEIGTWRGESVANAALVARQCTTVNLPDEQMRAMGLAEDYIGMHRFFSGSINNVKHIQTDSQTFDFVALGKKFDLIFIDGDHHREAIAKDSTTAFSLLKDERSVIIWHDYAFEPGITRFSTLLGILDGIPAEEHKHIYAVSNTLCAIYSRASLDSETVRLHAKPAHYFSLRIKSQRTDDPAQ